MARDTGISGAGERARGQSMTTERRVLFWLLIVAAMGSVLYLLRGALLPFVAGMAVAYLLDPLADRLQRLGWPRWLAAFAIVAAFIGTFVGVLLPLVPAIADQVVELINRIPDLVGNFRNEVEALIKQLRSALTTSQVKQVDAALSSQTAKIAEWVGNMIGSVISGGAAMLNLLGLLLITPVTAFYLLRDWDEIVGRINQLLPKREGEAIRGVMREIDDRLSGFVRGQVLVCALLGAWYATGLTLIGLDFGLVVGITAGLLSVIPFIGNFIGLGTSLLIAFWQFDDWQSLSLVVAVFVSGQILEGNFITPKIVGDRVGLHPVWLIFAVTAGSYLLGITGALLAVPVAAAMGVLIRFGIEQYLKSPLYTAKPEPSPLLLSDHDPPPAPAEKRTPS
jgi:predicted PurR-regulated permease PerM